jgi:Tol biopolymer transport system component
MSQVWDAHVGAASLDYQVFLIRRALGKNPDGRDYIETVPRRGFRFTGAVARVARRNGLVLEPAAGPAVAEAATTVLPPVVAATAAPSGRRSFRVLLMAIIVGGTVLAAAAAVGFSSGGTLRIVESRALRHSHPPSLGFPLLIDGDRIYYDPAPYGNRLVLPTAGGESTDAFDRASHFWLVDPGRPGIDRLAIRSDDGREGALWSVPAGRGSPRQVGQLTAEDARWSPDGRRIAFTSREHLAFAASDGGNVVVVPMPREGRSSRFPSWSPDGSVVRFTVTGDSPTSGPTSTLWEVRPDGSGLRPVLRDWDDRIEACCGVWSPDGRHFVFQGYRGDGRTDLWVLTEPSRLRRWLSRDQPPTQLSAGPLSLAGPAMSPDGHTLYAVGALTQGELVRWDPNTRAFVPYLGGLSGTWVTFSPDRQWVAYVGYPDRTLWRAKADGTERSALVRGDFELDGVTWSPDGQWIAFRSRMAGRHMRIFLISSAGGTPVPISERDQEQGIASWSADSRQLVCGDVPARFGVPDGDEVLHLYDIERRTFSSVPGSEGLWTARWSPDGRFIAALTIAAEQQQRMRLFDTTTRRWRALDATHVDNPTWSHDSRYVYYDTEGQAFALRRVSVADGRVEHLTRMDFPIAVHGWSGLTPDDSPMVLKNLSTPKIYALTLERAR